MSPPAGRYSGDYPRRWLGGDHPRLPRWPQRRGFTRRPEGDAAGSPGQSSRPGLLGLADLVRIVPEDLDQPLAVARVDRELAREELGVGAGANGEGCELDQLRRRPGDHLDAQHLLGRSVEDELQAAAVLARRPPVRRARQVVAGDVALDATAQRLGMRESDARDLGRVER